MLMKKILLIEDEKNQARFIELELKHESYSVTVAYDGNTGLDLALREHWDAILLDLMLPGMNGIEVCRQIRSVKKTPIIMLTARDHITDRVAGLDSGADDYIPKPFAIEELFARLRSLFRRVDEAEKPDQILSMQDIQVHLDARIVKVGDQTVELTKREFDLLVTFMKNMDRVLTREMLLDQVWGYDTEVETNVVDVYVRYLRNKIGRPGKESRIQTLRGIGYVMRR
jgi:DNA-binding response OmpR family regulator